MTDVPLIGFETKYLERAGISRESVAGRVYAHMADQCSESGHRVCIIVAKVAEHVGGSARSVQYALRKLEKAILLEFVSSGHEGSVYAVLQRVDGNTHPPPGQLLLDDSSRYPQQCHWTGNSWWLRPAPAGRRKGAARPGGGDTSPNGADTGLRDSEIWYLKKAEISLESVAGRVYAHMADQCSESSLRVCIIVAKVAEHVGVSKRSAQYALRDLEEASLLKFVSSGHRGSDYALLKRVVGARAAHPPPGQLLPYDSSRYRQHWRWEGSRWNPWRRIL